MHEYAEKLSGAEQPESVLESMVSRLRMLSKQAEELASVAAGAANHLLGSQPEPVRDAADSPRVQQGVIGRLDVAMDHLARQQDILNKQLKRLREL